MPLDLQYDILNDAPASASPVEANLNRIENYVNLEVIVRDGSVQMTGQLKLVGDPVSALDAATKQYVDQFLPVGIIMMFGGTTAPPGGRWAMCNGAELESALYPALYQAIERNWTLPAVPAGRFNLPNFNDRVPVGVGATTTIGKTGGTRAGSVIAHTHDIAHNHASFNSGNNSVSHTHTINHDHASATTSSAGVHDHFITNNQVLQTAFGGTGAAPSTGGASGIDTFGDDGAHTHTVNLPSFSGSSGGNSVAHTHSIDVPALGTTASGAASGAVTAAIAADANMPPYLGVPYIMRVS